MGSSKSKPTILENSKKAVTTAPETSNNIENRTEKANNNATESVNGSETVTINNNQDQPVVEHENKENTVKSKVTEEQLETVKENTATVQTTVKIERAENNEKEKETLNKTVETSLEVEQVNEILTKIEEIKENTTAVRTSENVSEKPLPTTDSSEEILYDLLKKISKDQKYDNPQIEIKPVTTNGANYSSILFVANIKADNMEGLNLFAKVASMSEKIREGMSGTALYTTEAFVYQNLVKTYQDLEDKHNVSQEHRFVFSKFYGCRNEYLKETIVLENLMAKGFGSFDRFKSIDWDQAYSAVLNLAKFHALAFAYQKEKPEEYAEVIKKYAFVMPEDNKEMEAIWLGMMTEKLNMVDEKYRENIKKCCDSDAFKKFNSPRENAIMVHGDYRASNLLYKKEDGKTETMVVDYQTIRSGCPVADLIYFIFMGTDAKFRADHYDHLIEHYYLQLSFAMARLGVDATEVYPREVYDSDLKEMLGFGVLLAVAVLPVVLVEAENAPRVDGEADPTNWVIKPNDLYAERFTGIIADCARWGVI